MPCNICKSKKRIIIEKSVRDSKKHKIVRCQKCLHIQISPIPSLKDNKQFYDDNSQIRKLNIKLNLKELKNRTRIDTERRVRLLKKIINKKSKILEIGSGYGFFLNSLKEYNKNLTGVEISTERRNKHIPGLKILNYNIEEEIPRGVDYDFILMFHVFEHSRYPKKMLRNVGKLLKKNGYIIIEVPNVNNFQLVFNDPYRKWFWQKAHVNYFSKDILEKLLKDAGFKNIEFMEVQRYSIQNMFNWMINQKPELDSPSLTTNKDIQWIDKYYKNRLEKKFLCDTLVVKAKK